MKRSNVAQRLLRYALGGSLLCACGHGAGPDTGQSLKREALVAPAPAEAMNAVQVKPYHRDELDALTQSVGLTAEQRRKAQAVLEAASMADAIAARKGPEASAGRRAQIAQQTRKALFNIVRREQEPLLERYVASR